MSNITETTNVVIKNVSFYWPNLVEPKEFMGKTEFDIQIRVPLDEASRIEEYTNGKVRTNKDEGWAAINLKKKAFRADGSPVAPIRVVDRNKEPIDPNTLGNGSKGNALLMIKPFEIKGPNGKVTKTGLSYQLQAIQITDLVVYEKKSNIVDMFDDEEDNVPAKKSKKIAAEDDF